MRSTMTRHQQHKDHKDKSFEDAVSALYSSTHQAQTKAAIEKSALRRTLTIQDMHEYLKRLSLNLSHDIAIIHITGTKGKGSTACFCESILRRQYGLQTGMFTSPHLVDIRERIRINGQPVSKSVFAEAYFHIRDQLEEFSDPQSSDLPTLPGYFRMLMLMAIYIFANYDPSIDVIVLEVGMGGRYDATNIFDMDLRNVVCGITLLDLDHTRILGSELEQIAWEKGGIFQVHKGSKNTSKQPFKNDPVGTPVDSSQDEEGLRFTGSKRFFSIGTNAASALSVLYECAKIEGLGQKLNIVHEGRFVGSNWKLGLEGTHQRINAELAHSLCEAVVEQMAISLPDKGMKGLQDALRQASWPGRCQSTAIKVQTSSLGSIQVNLRCDGAHTSKSIESGLSWFQSVSSIDPAFVMRRALIFNCGHERNPVPLLKFIHSLSKPNNADAPLFESVYFCRADAERPSMVNKSSARELLIEAGFSPNEISSKDDLVSNNTTWQDTLAHVWNYLQDNSGVRSNALANLTVKEAIDNIKSNAERSSSSWSARHGASKLTDHARVEVCITGSLYLVGSALDAISWTEKSAQGCLKR